MNRNLVPVCLVVLVTALAAAPIQAADPLVLADGTSLEVTRTQVEGGLVYATFASGAMQAYPVEDVDLVASGLAPAPKAEAPTTRRAAAITDAQAESSGSGVTITDEHVGHVKPEPPAAEGEAEEASEGGGAAALLVAITGQDRNGAMLELTGEVSNNGTAGVSVIVLTATALDGERVAGKGTTTITDELAPKGKMTFSMAFPVEGQVTNVQMKAQASMADFDFTPQAAPAGEASDG